MKTRILHQPWLQIGLVTLPFLLAYPLLRSLPDTECAFLHYDTIGDNPAGTEFCGASESIFIDLERISFPVTVELVPFTKLNVGERAKFSIMFRTSRGKPIYPWELGIFHTEKIHLLIIDPSLGDYHHIHPKPLVKGGQFGFELTPEKTGTYKIFAELVPLASQSLVIGEAEFEVSGALGKALLRRGLSAEVGDYRFQLDFPGGSPPILKQPSSVSLRITRGDETGPIVLEEIMGAYAHLVAFDQHRRGFAHMHPLDAGSGFGTSETSFNFSLNTDLAGYYRVWAQVKIEGRELFVPFDLVVP